MPAFSVSPIARLSFTKYPTRGDIVGIVVKIRRAAAGVIGQQQVGAKQEAALLRRQPRAGRRVFLREGKIGEHCGNSEQECRFFHLDVCGF